MSNSLISQAFLVHYGEIALKRGNRRRFEELLAQNIQHALRPFNTSPPRRLQGRMVIDVADVSVSKEVMKRLQRVFGIANIAPVVSIPSRLEEIEREVDHLTRRLSFESFAIRTRRSEKNFPLTSVEMNIRLGERVGRITGARVDLEYPQQEIFVEILDRTTFLFTERLPGPGGLPVGSAGKVLVLLSGGIDSPVAAWRMMKRGCLAVYLHFSSIPFTSRESIEKAHDLVERLSVGQPEPEVVVVPFGEIQQKIVAAVPEAYRVLLYRRFMMRIAEAIARTRGATALVTGESLSQVASQTLSNLASIEAAVTMPVLRPLIGMDKQEIVDEAKHIGTFTTSCEPHDDCCSFLMPDHPTTRSTPEELDRLEASLPVEELVEKVKRAF